MIARLGRQLVVAVVLVVMALGSLLLGSRVVAELGLVPSLPSLLLLLVLLAYPVVGAVILRRGGHPVGWLLLGLGAVLGWSHLDVAVVDPIVAGTSAPWLHLIAVVSSVSFPLFVMLTIFLGYRFPDGRSLGGWFLVLERMGIVGVIGVATAMVLAPALVVGPSDQLAVIANPLVWSWSEPVRVGAERLAVVTFGPSAVASVVALIVRYRRSVGVERLQLRWLTSTVVLALVTWPVLAGLTAILLGAEAASSFSNVYTSVLFAVPTVGIGIAITRYRLYDLDRLVSRTVTYLLVTVLLLAVYAGSVLVAGLAMRPLAGRPNDLVVAGSTLAVAAAFQPARRRLQAIVDRRFHRRRVDAQRIVEGFGRHLRDELDLSTILAELVSTARVVAQPSSVAVTVSGEGGRTVRPDVGRARPEHADPPGGPPEAELPARSGRRGGDGA
jgi:hypothetical protein